MTGEREVDSLAMEKSEAAARPDQSLKSGIEKKWELKNIVETLKNVKELLLIAAFFGAGLVWVVNYFATRSQLEEFECFTKINVRMLQATANVNYTEHVAKQGRIELRDHQRMLDKASKASNKASETDIKATQGRIDDLKLQTVTFEKTIETENKAAKRGFAALTQNLCLIKEQRTKILGQLASGDF